MELSKKKQKRVKSSSTSSKKEVNSPKKEKNKVNKSSAKENLHSKSTADKKLKRKLGDKKEKHGPVAKKWKGEGDEKKVVFRRKLINNYDNIVALKALWEELRKKNLDADKRDKLCKKILKIIKGHAKEYIFAHDTSRIVQSLFKYGDMEMKEKVFAELKDDVLNIMKSQYARFLIKKLIKYGSKPMKSHVLNSLHGNLRKLIRHSYASDILDYLYSEYCNASQRATLLAEFYGADFALFRSVEARSLEEILASEPSRRKTILSDMKPVLAGLREKSVIQYSLVHKLFLEYFTNADDEGKRGVVEMLREVLPHVIHTRDGASLARHVIWHSNVKDRRLIMKSLRGNITKLCNDDIGHTVLLALLDSVDDTVNINHFVLKEMSSHVEELVGNANGRRVLLYLLDRRNSRHCTPALLRLLLTGDSNPNSKKPAHVRAEELMDYTTPWLLTYVAKNIATMSEHSAQLVLVSTLLQRAKKGDLPSAFEAVASLYCAPFGENHAVERSDLHLVFKQLAQADRQRSDDSVKFSEILLKKVPRNELKKWCTCNRGCYNCLFLLETDIDNVRTRVLEELSTEKEKIAKRDKLSGAQLLLKKL